jgi:hypothetical protein
MAKIIADPLDLLPNRFIMDQSRLEGFLSVKSIKMLLNKNFLALGKILLTFLETCATLGNMWLKNKFMSSGAGFHGTQNIDKLNSHVSVNAVVVFKQTPHWFCAEINILPPPPPKLSTTIRI